MSLPSAAVTADIAYLAPGPGPAEHRIYPPASGRPLVRPSQVYHAMRIEDLRASTRPPDLDREGFMLCRQPATVRDFYDDDEVRRVYYPEVAELLRTATGAVAVLVFDHNQRSAVRAAAGQAGVRAPVDAAHVDYTPGSGPRRAREILAAAGRADLAGHRLALVNLWRPIVGPVEDVPLALCDAQSTAAADFVDTAIHHFGEDDLERPRHSGEILSLRHNPAHRWFYAPSMQPDEALLLKNWDSADGPARFMPHTGFRNPAALAGAPPRESIEARTLVVLP